MLKILLFLFISMSFLFSQTWKNTVTLNVSAGNDERIDLFTDNSGNHMIVQSDNQLKYYLYSYNGSLVRSAVIDNYSETKRLSAITGYEGKIYVVYKKSSQILAKKSTDNGQNWSTNITPISMNYSTSDGLDITSDVNGVHLAWSEKYGEPNYYETRYGKLPHSYYQWTDLKQVTDYGSDEGGHPTITVSSNKIHVGYAEADNPNPYENHSTSNGTYKIRIKDNGVWQNPETIFSYTYSANIIADNFKLNSFSYNSGDISVPSGEWGYEFIFKNGNLSGGGWGNNQSANQGYEDILVTEEYRVDLARTNNNSIHFVFNGELYREWDGSQFGSQYDFGNGINSKITANGNDVYIVWIENGNVKLKQCDSAPLTPANFDGSWSGNHPRISWTKSRAADFKEYIIEKRAINANWAEYQTITNKNTISFVDNTEDKYTGGGYLKGYVYYRMKQKDMTNNISPLTDSERFAVNGLQNIDNAGNDAPDLKVDDFALIGNYPNPFNPLTKIAFNLPTAEYVTLEVFDVNGKKVNTLVSEYKEAGSYSVNFDAQDLSSGIYIYKIIAGEFRALKRMLLIK